jgi:acyl-CoA thioester hydrolase
MSEDLLKDYSVVIETPVAWGEMDAFQHVNNIIYFRYFESVRMAYFGRLNMTEFMERTGVGPILAETRCRFKIPLTYPDTVSVGARITQMQEDRYVMEYRVVSHNHKRAAAEGEGVIVAYDYRAKKKTTIPDEMKLRIAEIEKW